MRCDCEKSFRDKKGKRKREVKKNVRKTERLKAAGKVSAAFIYFDVKIADTRSWMRAQSVSTKFDPLCKVTHIHVRHPLKHGQFHDDKQPSKNEHGSFTLSPENIYFTT